MDKNFIIDAGMHKGEDTLFYLKKGFRVVGIEANAELCKIVESTLSDYIASGQLTIINKAISDASGPVEFFTAHAATVWGTTQRDWMLRNEKMGIKMQRSMVDTVRFESILEKFGVPYYLKIDIEGNDLLCLEALENFRDRPAYISIESIKTSWNELKRELDLFESLGYYQFKVINQKLVPNQVCPSPAREGVAFEHVFSKGASGLFGEETPGAWQSRKRTQFLYRYIYFKYWLYGNDGIFPNLHRKTLRYKKLSNLLHPGWYDTHAQHKHAS